MKSAYLDSGIHFYQCDNGRQPVILLHGITDDGCCWPLLTDALKHDYNLIMPDARGHGKSTWTDDYSVNAHAEDLKNLIDELALVNPIVLGHSMGGMIVQEIAKISGEKINKLICFATGSIGDIPGRFETMDESIKRLNTEGIKKSVERIPQVWFV